MLYDAGVSASQGAGEQAGAGALAAGEVEAPMPDLAAERDRLGKRKRVEKLAVRYFKRRAGMAVRPQPGDAVHYLNPEERRTLRRIERNAVLRAAAAGAFAATLGATSRATPTGDRGCATPASRC